MGIARTGLVGALGAWLARRRFPTLLIIAAAAFLADLVIPDVIPFADEILLGALTAILAAWRKRGATSPPRERRV